METITNCSSECSISYSIDMPRKSSVSGIYVSNESQMLPDPKLVTCSNQWPFVPTALLLLYRWVSKNLKDKASSWLCLARLYVYIYNAYPTEKPAGFIVHQFASINEGSLPTYMHMNYWSQGALKLTLHIIHVAAINK